MNIKNWSRGLVILLTLSLTGCGMNTDNLKDNIQSSEEYIHEDLNLNHEANNTETDKSESSANLQSTITTTQNVIVTTNKNKEQENIRKEESKNEEEILKLAENQKILEEQKNSYSMMCYLALTAEEIRSSKDNRLALEDIYTSLLNDINPSAINERTQEHLGNLRDIIKQYLNLSTKRERLQFIYNQEKAEAIRSAVPDPLAVLSISNVTDWKKLASTAVYTAVDSYNNYKSAQNTAEMSFIMSGWELDDEEKEAVMKNRDRAFDYMVDMVQEYKLDGLKTLNENSIKKFAEICAIENTAEKLKLLKSEKEIYSEFGDYWLELADAYFQTSQYIECLDCIEQYNVLSTGIYRKDYNYLQILPKVIVAAQQTYSGTNYVDEINKYAEDIKNNTSTYDWSVRYFLAQVYLDLYSKTNYEVYIRKAYDIVSDNVTVLLKEQRTLNSTYLDKIVKQEVTKPEYDYMTESEKKTAKKEYKAERKQVKKYNSALKKKRKTELPQLYEPLVLNCELLFALSEKIEISDSEKNEIEAILESENNGVFIVKPINDVYKFNTAETQYSIDMNENEIIIPAYLLTQDSKIEVIISENGNKTVCDDCSITEVKRKGKNIEKYKAYIKSKRFKKHDWTIGTEVEVRIIYNDAYGKQTSYKFLVNSIEEKWYGNKVKFEEQ